MFKFSSDKTIKIILLEFILKYMAKTVLWRHKPFVIGVTGSIGKTTTREAIYHLVKTEYRTRTASKNYNNEIGVPLTILGVEGGAGSILDLLRIFKVWVKNLLDANYLEMLVLELGIDRPNDMEYLLSIVKIDIGVVNHVTNVHREFFKSTDEIAKEKGKIIENLRKSSKGGFAILNEDDSRVKKMVNRTNGEVMTYGYKETADLHASDISHIFEDNKFQGISFKLNYDGKTIPIRLNNVLAEYHVYAILAAIAVANVLKMNIVELAEQISSFRPPVGRMNLLEGINSSMVIDDTYNASPKATEAAIDTFLGISSKRKIVALGDMLELGEDEGRDHKNVMNKLKESDVDVVFLVGQRMREAGKILVDREDMEVMFFDGPMDAGEELKGIVEAGDLVLVKGSQGMRMEKVVEGVVLDRGNMGELLCRQGVEWKNKLYRMP